MVEVFLSVERLSAGQMELKREPIAVNEMVGVCVGRVKPLAERKRIAIHVLHARMTRLSRSSGDRGVDGVRLLQSSYQRSQILAAAD